MPDLTIIEGGNNQSFNGIHDALHEIAIEILRSVVNGSDRTGSLESSIRNLIARWPAKEFDLHAVLQDRMIALNKDVFGQADDAIDSEINDVVRSSMQLAANRMCHDYAAPARSSRTEKSLIRAIETHAHSNRLRSEEK